MNSFNFSSTTASPIFSSLEDDQFNTNISLIGGGDSGWSPVTSSNSTTTPSCSGSSGSNDYYSYYGDEITPTTNNNSTSHVDSTNNNNIINTSTAAAATNVTDDSSSLLSPSSCIRCRKMHKFCTKTKPTCKRCQSANVECIYKPISTTTNSKVSKKKKQKHSSSTTTINNNNNSTNKRSSDDHQSSNSFSNKRRNFQTSSSSPPPHGDNNTTIITTTNSGDVFAPSFSSLLYQDNDNHQQFQQHHVIATTTTTATTDSQQSQLPIMKEHDAPWYFSFVSSNFFFIQHNNNNALQNSTTATNSISDCDELEHLITKYENIEPSESNIKERKAFQFSIQSLEYQSSGQFELAQEYASKSRKFISKCENPDSILLSYSLLNLSLFELGCGNSTQFSYYIHCSKFQNKLSTRNFQTNQHLQRTILFIEQFSSLSESDILQFHCRLPQLFEFVCGVKLPLDLSTKLQFYQQLGISKENCLEVVKIGTQIINLMISNLLQQSSRSDENHLHNKNLQFTKTILIEGLKLGIYITSLSRKDLIEDCSLSLTYLFTSSPTSSPSPEEEQPTTTTIEQKSFDQTCSLFMIPFILMATRVNIQVVRSIQAGSRLNHQFGSNRNGHVVLIDYYEILKLNLKTLNNLQLRFKRISNCSGSVLQSLNELLKNY